MPAAATAGAIRPTHGLPVPRVNPTPASSTITVAITQPSNSDGVITSARARRLMRAALGHHEPVREGGGQ